MKRSFVNALLIVFAVSTLSSCKKNYVCECHETRTSSNGSTTTTPVGNYTFKDTRARAETRCVEQEDSGSDIFGPYSIDCEIK